MDTIIVLLLKQLGPYATIVVVVVILWYKIKNIETCKLGCQEKVKKMEKLITKNSEVADTKYALSSECKIFVNNILTNFGRFEKRLDNLEATTAKNHSELSAKQDANTDKIINLIMKGYKNE